MELVRQVIKNFISASDMVVSAAATPESAVEDILIDEIDVAGERS